MIIAVCGEQYLYRGMSRNGYSRGSFANASVVVTTTSSHVNAEGTIDDPMDEDLLSKPRGFFADQFEVLVLIKQMVTKLTYA
jgi:hypothetical protein